MSKELSVLLSKIDSDDMISKDYIELTQKQAKFEKMAIICKNGYVLFSGGSPTILRRIKWAIGRLLTKLKIK